jgi:hypothetical protein
MARNFLALSRTYLDTVSARQRRLDAAVAEHLDESYEVQHGQIPKVIAALKKEGWTLTKTQVQHAARRYRIPYLMLTGRSTVSVRQIVKRGHAIAEGWACLQRDRLTTWSKVEARLALSAGEEAAPEVLFSSQDIVVLRRADYDELSKSRRFSQRLQRLLTEIRKT